MRIPELFSDARLGDVFTCYARCPRVLLEGFFCWYFVTNMSMPICMSRLLRALTRVMSLMSHLLPAPLPALPRPLFDETILDNPLWFLKNSLSPLNTTVSPMQSRQWFTELSF